MSNIILARNYTAGGAIPAFRLVRLSAAETVVLATAGTDAIIGAIQDVSPANGERVDVVHMGVAFIEAGAAVAQGALLMADANGRAITATAAAGSNVRTIGFAIEAAAALGDQIRVQLSPGSFQG